MITKNTYTAPDWGQTKWIGNPNNQKRIATFAEGPYSIGLSTQDFRCPRFWKTPHFGDCYIFIYAWLDAPHYRYVSVHRHWDTYTPETRAEAELTFSRLVEASCKVQTKRPKDMRIYLNAVANLTRLP